MSSVIDDVSKDSGIRMHTATNESAVAEGKVIRVSELLAYPKLNIPEYQRPYKWTTRNVAQLFTDIAAHKDKPAYRLGTIVLHRNTDDKEAINNIVDGQQRTITLMLALHALKKALQEPTGKTGVGEKLRARVIEMAEKLPLAELKFASDISLRNIYANHAEIRRIVSRAEFTAEMIEFLLDKCEVVVFTLRDVSEAFQFFDSQNARGKDLEPHDLLKAFHLREFGAGDDALKMKTIERWENSDTEELARLFDRYLYRIRNWANGRSAQYFTKHDVSLFKGVNVETIARYPYVEPIRTVHYFVDQYNGQYERNIDGQMRSFPFQLDQAIINGRRFFEMAAHYQARVGHIRARSRHLHDILNGTNLDGFAPEIMDTINDYPGRHRTGDRYVRTIFDCLLVYYIDKFGEVELSRAIEKIFIWSYSLRLNLLAVRLASMDNHVLSDPNLFRVLREAIRPSDFTLFPLKNIEKTKFEGVPEIKDLFVRMKYL